MLARMTRILLVVSLLTILAAGLASAAVTPEYDDLIRQTRAAIARGDSAQALVFLDQALRINPAGADLFILMGQVYCGLSRHAEAAAALRKAADLLGEKTTAGQDALCEMAAALASSEQNLEAIGTLQRVLELAPRRIGVHRDIGEIELALGDRKSTRLNSSHSRASRMPSSA